MLRFDFDAVRFLKNPPKQQALREIVKRGTKSNPIHHSKTKNLFRDIKISYTFSFTATGISMFHKYIRKLQCAVTHLRLALLLPPETITLPTLETSKRSHSDGWAMHCQSVDKQRQKIFFPDLHVWWFDEI